MTGSRAVGYANPQHRSWRVQAQSMTTKAIRKRVNQVRKGPLFICAYKGCGWISDRNSLYCVDHDKRRSPEDDSSRRRQPLTKDSR